MHNLIEYSGNYSDTSGSLWQFKRNEVLNNNADLTIDNSQSFKYKAALIEKTANAVNDTNSSVKNEEIVVSLNYLSNFWRSLEVSLINCEIHLELDLIKDCIFSRVGDSAKFKITDVKLHFPLLTLSNKDNVHLAKQLSDGFKRSVHWNNYQAIPPKVINQGTNIFELLSASFQDVKRLFVFAYTIAANTANNKVSIKNNGKYFLPKGKIENYNVLIDGRNFYDQPINDLIKQYDEVRKLSTGQGDHYTIGCFLDCAYFRDSCRLIAVDLTKQKALDADLRATQQKVFQGAAGGTNDTKIKLYTIFNRTVHKGATNIL